MKKLLISILALSLIVASSFGTGIGLCIASADSEVQSQEIADSKRLLEATGLIVNVGEEGITRGDFLVALISSMNNNLSSVADKQYFVDADRDSMVNTAAGYALAGDIISAGQYFAPERNVTYSEAIKMMTAALGYGIEAQARGGYPTGYFVVASKIGLTKAITYSPDAALSPYHFYVMMKNFLESPVKLIDGINNDENGAFPSYTTGESILTELYGWTKAEGVVSADKNTYLYDNKDGAYDVVIGDKQYLCSIDCPIGMNVVAYAKYDGGKDRIVYVQTAGLNRVETLVPSEIEEITDNSLSVYQNGKTRKYTMDGLYSVIYNGKFCAGTVSICKSVVTGSVTLIDNNTDGKYDVCIVKDSKIMEVGSNNDYSECIYDVVSGELIDYSGDKKIVVYSGDALSSVSAIKSGDVLEYYESEDKESIEIHILKNTIDGKYSAVSDNSIYINDAEYKYSQYFQKYNLPTLKLGSSASFILTTDGCVASVGRNDSSGSILAYMTGIIQSGALIDSTTIRVFNINGEFLTIDTAQRVRLNDSETLTSQELYQRLAPVGEQTIRYKLNADGKVSAIYTENSVGIFDPSIDNPDGLKRYNYDGYDAETKVAYKTFGSFVPHFTIDANSKILFVNDRELVPTEEDRFSVGGMDALKNDTTTPGNKLLAFNVDSSGRAEYVVRLAGSSGGSVVNASSYGVIESVTRALDKKESSAYKITLCSGNEYRSYFVPDNSALILNNKITDANGNLTLKCGDYVRYTANSNMELNDITIDFSIDAGQVKHSADRENYEVNYYYGTLYDYAGTSIRIDLLSSSLKGYGYPITLVNRKSYVWLVDTENETVTAVAPQTMVSAMQNSDSPDVVLFKTRYADIQEIVVYR